MRKALAILTAGAVMAPLILGVCGSAQAAKSIEVDYWVWGEAFPAMMKEMVAAFNKKWPNIKVVPTFVEIGQTYTDKLLLRTISGAPPDLVWGDAAWIGPIYSKNQIANLKPYIARDKVDMNAYHKWAFESHSSIDGSKLYGFPYFIYNYQIWYNKQLFAQAGLPNPTGDWNTDEFLETARRLTRDINGDNKTDIYGCQGNAFGWWGETLAWLQGFGGSFYNAELNSCLINQPNAVKCFQYLADLSLKYKVTPRPGTLNYEKTAMTSGSSYDLPNAASLFKFKFGLVPHPRGPKMQPFCSTTNGWYIPAGSKKKEEAWTFLRFMISKEGQDIVLKHKYIPIRKYADDQLLPGVEQEHRRATAYAMARTTIDFEVPMRALNHNKNWALFQEAMAKVESGKYSVQNAMDTAVKAINVNLKRGAGK